MYKFKRYLMFSQIHLFSWLTVASVLASSVVFANGGVSNYGNHYTTVPFYSFAFLGSSFYIYLAADSLLTLNKKFKIVSIYLYILCLFLVLVFVSTFPRRFGDIFSDIHDNVSKLLFAYEFLLAIWLAIKRPEFDALLYTLIMAAGSMIGLLSSIHILDQMFVGQMVGALGFGLLLVYVLPKVIIFELAGSNNSDYKYLKNI